MADLEFNVDLDVGGKTEAKSGAETIERMERALRGADRQLTGLTRHMDGLRGPVGGLGRVLTGAREALNSFGRTAFIGLGVGAVAGVGAATVGLVALGREMVQAAQEQERLELSFRSLFGQKVGTEYLDWAGELARRTRYADDQIAGFIRQLSVAGVTAGNLPAALAGALDIGVITGAGGESAVNALAMMAQSGQVMDRQLRAFGLTERQVFDNLIRDTGKSEKELRKLMGAGRLDGNVVVRAVLQGVSGKTGQQLGALALQEGDTIGARMRRLGDAPGEILEGFLNTGAFKQLSDTIGGIADYFDPAKPGGKRVVAAMENMVGQLGAALKGVDLAELADGVVKGIEFTVTALRIAGTVASGVVTAFSTVGETLGVMAAEIYLGAERIWNGVASLPRRFAELGANIWRGLRDGIMGGVTAVTDAVSGMGDAVVGRLKGLLGIRSPSRVFEDMGMMTGAGFVRGLRGSAGSVDLEVRRTFTPPALPAPSAYQMRGGRVGGGSVTIAPVITVNVTGDADGERIGEDISRTLTRLLQTGVERWRLEAGT